MRVVLVMLAAMGGAPAAAADTAAPPASVGRFELAPADTGFIRLDTETGATMHCAEDGGIWVCAPLGIDSALSARVDALAAEVARLTSALAALLPATTATGARVDALAADVDALAAEVAALAAAAEPLVTAVAGAPAPARPVEPIPALNRAPAGLLAEALDRFLAFVAALKHG